MEATKIKAPICKCGNTAKLMQMLTFEYFYCQACKVEVGGKAHAPSIPAPDYPWEELSLPESWSTISGGPKTGALPYGYVALKGEDLKCSVCGASHGTLNQDLPALKPARDPNLMVDFAKFVKAGDNCCPFESVISPRNLKWFIGGRGWV